MVDELPLGVFGGSTEHGSHSQDHEHDNDEIDNGEEKHSVEYHRLEAAVSGLQISSQLARNSEKYYDTLSRVFTAPKLVWMLTQTDDAIVAKTCNLVGNLCRHSGRFYPVLAASVRTGDGGKGGSKVTILDLLARGCGDKDPSVRKFSSFAVGNAAFHSAELYPALAPTIEPLSAALDDRDPKTRANVAGAIGNLIRNGGQLSKLMASRRVPERLMHMAASDKDIQPQVRDSLCLSCFVS